MAAGEGFRMVTITSFLKDQLVSSMLGRKQISGETFGSPGMHFYHFVDFRVRRLGKTWGRYQHFGGIRLKRVCKEILYLFACGLYLLPTLCVQTQRLQDHIV